jgi:hypothetical protein
MDLGELFPQLYLPTRVTWDGEAFQVHGENGATVAVARVSTSGEVLLPKTDFGVSWNPGYGPLGYRLEYEPVTELTWIWDGDGAGSGLVQAHDKLGAPLFPYPGVVVEPVHTVAQTGSSGMAAHPGGLDLFWTEAVLPVDVQVGARLGLDGSVTDVFTFEHTFEHQNGEQGNGFHASAVYRRADGSTWAVGVDQYGARLFTLDYEAGAAALSPRFYDHTISKKEGADLREMRLFEVDGTLWFVFHETGQGLDAPVWRVLELNPGCVYKSWLRLVEDGETGVE